jgi:rRNA maturation endonuclease Nob1
MGEIIAAVKQYVAPTRSPTPSPYACQTCGVRFDSQRQVCPACGGYTIERTDWPRLDH